MTRGWPLLAVCQTPPVLRSGDAGWDDLAARCRGLTPDLLLLSEMPFGRWPGHEPERDEDALAALRRRHEEGLARLGELGAGFVLSSRPRVDGSGRSVNEGFAWTAERGAEAVHTKQFLPEEPGYWETRWWERGETDFRVGRLPLPAPAAPPWRRRTDAADGAGTNEAASVTEGAAGGPAVERGGGPPGAHFGVGFLICTEVMFNEWARHYGRAGAHLIAVPRATPPGTEARWKTACAMAAVVSGCWVASSNRAGVDDAGNAFAGAGWIFHPSGRLVAETSEEEPVVAVELDLEAVEAAQRDYPCYVEDLPPGPGRPHPAG